MKSAFSELLKSRPIWLFVDALDECGKDNAIELTKTFKSMLREHPCINSRFHICFTCRHYPIVDLDDGLEICAEHENKEAIFTYTSQVSTSIPLEIQKTVSRRAAGIFMWTRLAIERINSRCLEGVEWGTIKEEIDVIPDDLDTLYQDLIKSMAEKAASLKLIKWICFATQPLKPKDLKWAMIIDNRSPHKSLQKYKNVVVDDERFKRQWPC